MSLTRKQDLVTQRLAKRLEKYADNIERLDINSDDPDMVLLKSDLSALAASGAEEYDVSESIFRYLNSEHEDRFRSFVAELIEGAYKNRDHIEEILNEDVTRLNVGVTSRSREPESEYTNRRFYGMLAGIGGATFLGLYAFFSEPNETIHSFIANFIESGQKLPQGVEGIERVREIVYRSGMLTKWIQGGIAATIGYHLGDKLTRAGMYIKTVLK